jgi:head-tail adaptor
MRAGKLRHRVTIQRPVVSQDADGGQLVAWVDVTGVWARVSPVKMTEQLIAQQVDARLTHEVEMRGRAFPPEYRLRFGTRILEPTGVRDSDERGIMLLIAAMEKA